MNISAPQYGNICRPISKGLYVNAFLLLLTVVIAITPVLNRNLPKLIYIGIILLWYIEVFFQGENRPIRPPTWLFLCLSGFAGNYY